MSFCAKPPLRRWSIVWLPHRPLRRRGSVCHAVDTVFGSVDSFDKLVATRICFGEKTCRKTLPLGRRNESAVPVSRFLLYRLHYCIAGWAVADARL